MISSDRKHMGLLGSNGEKTYYITTPARCSLLDMRVTAQNSDIGDADIVTLKDSSGNTMGVATFDSNIAAGAKATFARNATHGYKTLDAGEVCSVVVSALDAVGDRVDVEIVWHLGADQAADYA